MKWFKHKVGSGDDPDIDDAYSLYGAEGYYVFFRTLEIMGREYNRMDEDGWVEISWEFFRKKYRISPKKLLKVLAYFQEKTRIFFRFREDGRMRTIQLKCPKLDGLRDDYTRKKNSKCPDIVRTNSGPLLLDKDIKNKIKIKNKNKNKSTESTSVDSVCSELEIPAPEPQAENVFLRIPLIEKAGGDYVVTDDMVAEWEEAYPAVDVKQALRNIREWNISRPKQRKTKRGIRGHITSWLAKEQDRGRGQVKTTIRRDWTQDVKEQNEREADLWMKRKLEAADAKHF